MEFLIPSHASRPSDDPIFSLNAEARQRAGAGESIVNATIGVLLDDEGSLAVLGTVLQTLREVPADAAASYAPISGPPAFLNAVVEDLLGGRPEADWAVAAATPGGSGALRTAIAAFTGLGEASLTSSFFWAPYNTISDENGRKLATFRMFDERGRLDVVDLERKLVELLDKQGRALVILNSPCHNPTGYTVDASEWDDIAAILTRHADRGPITLLLDMAYERYANVGVGTALDRLLPLAGKIMLLFSWSASKSFTLYGQRVGALIAVHADAGQRARVQNAFSYACRGTWSNCNAGGMAAVARVLLDPALRAKVDAERDALKEVMNRRAAYWNSLAGKIKLNYPRFEGGFFTTVFCDDAHGRAKRMRDDGVFVIPQVGALRVALCAVNNAEIERIVASMARHVA